MFAAEDLFKAEASTEFLHSTDRPADVPEQIGRSATQSGVRQVRSPTVAPPPAVAAVPRAAVPAASPTAEAAKAKPPSATKPVEQNVSLKVNLADKRVLELNVPANTTTGALEKLASQEAGLARGAKVFGLFTLVEGVGM